jgi:hypothetical protein
LGVGLPLAALTIPLLLGRIGDEETLLRCGGDDDAYRARTSRLMPGRW